MLSKRQRSTEVAISEKIAKLTPLPSQVAPSGYGYPNQIFTGVINERFLSATLLELATDEELLPVKRIEPELYWPQSWRESYLYDESEIYGRVSHYGYAYAYENRRRETLRLLTEVLSPG